MAETRARSDILARVRRACAGRPPEEIGRLAGELASGPAPELEAVAPAIIFLTRVLRNRGTVDVASSRAAAVEAVARFLRERFRSSKLVVANDARLAALPWRDTGLLPRFGSARDGDIAAVSHARLAVAETGGVVTYTGRSNPAGHNLLAEAHIVLVNTGDLVTTLEQAWERIAADMQAQGRPRGINFIAGPSSTADVEATLVMGAHGPRAWHVILVGDVPEDVPEESIEEARALAGLSPQSGV